MRASRSRQSGCATDDIIRGLRNALVGNYFSAVGKGQGILVPEHFDVRGAIGAAILAPVRDVQ